MIGAGGMISTQPSVWRLCVETVMTLQDHE